MSTGVKKTTDVSTKIWAISLQLVGIGELFSLAAGERPLNPDGLKGLSNLFMEFAAQLQELTGAYLDEDEIKGGENPGRYSGEK